MKANRQNLLNVLSSVKSGLASKDVVEQYVSFIFKGGRVYTYNEQVAISHPVECAFDGAVVAKEFYSILSKMKDAEVELEVDGGELRILGKSSKAGVRIQADFDLPFDQLNPSGWSSITDELATVLNFTSFCSSKDALDGILSCIHVKNDYVEACDRFRIVRQTLKSDFCGEVLIPARSVGGLKGHKPMQVCVGQGWIHFKNVLDVVYSIRTGEGDYPDLEGYFVSGGMPVHLPTDTLDILERAKTFVSGESDADMNVELSFESNKLTIRSQNEKGWFEESVDIVYPETTPLAFQANPEFFKEMLPLVKSMHILSNDPALPPNTGMVRFVGETFVHSFTTVMGGISKPEVASKGKKK